MTARQIAQSVNIPTIPGTDGPLGSMQEAQEFVQQYVPTLVSVIPWTTGGLKTRVPDQTWIPGRGQGKFRR